MKLKTNLILSLLLAVLVSFFIIKKMRHKTSTEIPELKNLKGEIVKAEQFKNKVLILSYFQTWCSDCAKEQPQLQKLQDKFGQDSFAILMVSDEPIEKIIAFKNLFNSELHFYHTGAQLKKDLDVKAFPSTYLFDKKGKVIIKKVEGINWYTDSIVQTIQSLLKD